MDALKPDDPQWVGPYRIEGRLGEGGMGSVFLGTSPGGRKVAVKLIKRELAAAPQFRQRFAREVEAARRVGGFHTAQVVDADPEAASPWLVTAFIAGPNLHEVVAADGPLSADAVLRLGAGLAEGLAAIHKSDLVHRDLKPGNVILAEDGPRIIDFGIARAVDASSLTATGTVIGTYTYMSPEQIRADRAGPASDVFSLGSVLAFAATGQAPFDAPTLIEVVQRILDQPPALDGVDDRLRPVLAACLAKDPAARPSVGDLPALFAGGPAAPADPRVPSAPQDGTLVLTTPPRQPSYAPTAPAESPAPPAFGPPPAGPTVPAAPTPGRPSRRALLIGGAGATAAVAVGAVALLRSKGDPDDAKGADGGNSPSPSASSSAEPSAGSSAGPSETYVALEGIESVRALAFSTDGTSLCATGNNAVCRWDLATREATPAHIGTPEFLQPTLISRDLKYVVRAEKTDVRVWNTSTGKTVRTFAGPKNTKDQDGWPTGLAISADSATVAVTSSRGLHLWNVADGSSKAVLGGFDGGPVAFRSDGLVLAAGSPLATRAPNGAPMNTVKDGEAAELVVFSPDGQVLAYVHRDDTVRVWNTDSAEEVVKLDPEESMMHAIAFHPGGRLLATGGQGGLACVWDTVTGRRTAKFTCPNSVEALAFSPDGKTLATGLMSAVDFGGTNTVLLWKLP
ncbi:WD40 repeat domain-containing serine/threonine protein kinase [Streptomyces sp. NPDC050085]|uniref:WD40 repeat domain-containing serine/threonine protein kinase n=1 Tax=Streptomyces sp. NPDC050085 TaxID=3365600 RepID=UPI003797AE54